VARGLGRRGHLSVRPHQAARRGLLHRHAAAHRVGHPAPGARVLLHPHRHHRPLPAHARARGLLPDGVGRQRPQRRAPGPDPDRHALRPVTALRPRLPAARERVEEGQADPGQPAQLRRTVRRGRRAARAELLRPVVGPRPVGRLDPDLPHHRPRGDQGEPAQLRPAGRARPPAPTTRSASTGRTGSRSGSRPPAPSCCRPASPSSPTPTTSATSPCSGRPPAPRCSASGCPSSPTTWPRPTRAPASP
jgi:hypothetical protein